jgi:TolB protein
MSSGELASVDLRDGSRTEIATGADYLNWFYWSPGGRWLTWWAGDRNVIVLADGTGTTELPALIGQDHSKSWSPDDSHLAVTTADGLLVGEGSGANLVNVGTFPSISSWSQDGSRFAYVLDGDAWIANSDGTAARNLTGFEFGGAQSVALSPDGETLAVVQAGIALWLIGLDGTRRQANLGPAVLQDWAALRWSRDGRLLAVETRHSYGEAAGTTYLVPVDRSAVIRLDGAWDPTWSPDGRYLALLATRGGVSGIDVANADGSGRVPVTTTAIGAGDDLVWVP